MLSRLRPPGWEALADGPHVSQGVNAGALRQTVSGTGTAIAKDGYVVMWASPNDVEGKELVPERKPRPRRWHRSFDATSRLAPMTSAAICSSTRFRADPRPSAGLCDRVRSRAEACGATRWR